MDAEFVLKNASVIEGSGLAPYKGHIHIIDGEIKDTSSAFVLRQFPEFQMDAEVPVGSSVDLWLTEDSSAAYVPQAPPLDSLPQ